MKFLINPYKGKQELLLPELENLLRYSDARSFHKTLEDYSPTSLTTLKGLSQQLGVAEIWVKNESSRFVLNAFKGLGASFAVYKYLQQAPGNHCFCTATDGNHGRAVAWATKIFGQKAVIFVPEFTVKERIENIKKEGAEVRTIKGHYDETVAAANAAAKENNWILIQDTSWEGYTTIPAWIISGYLTQFEEIDEQVPDQPYFDLMFLHAGVGSWASAGLWYYQNKYGNNAPKSVIVEPETSDGILHSILNNKLSLPSNSNAGHTIMAGLNCGIPSLISFPIFKNYADCFITIPDELAKEAMRKLFYPIKDDESIIAGETGAAGLAGLLQVLRNPEFAGLKDHMQINPHSKILIVNTEGATDKENFDRIVKT